jgi:hypothetical protein
MALTDGAARLTLEQLVRHPAGKWSPAEIIEHLGLAYSRTADGMQRVLDRTLTPPAPPSATHRFRTFLVVGWGYFPSGRTSPKEVAPVGHNPAEVLAFTLASLRRLDGVLDEVAQGFGGRTKVLKHHVLGPLSVAAWRKFHWVHTRHHARQIAERVNPLR